ncbi:aromatic ring-hydroxylating oxygenase subunit alpha [Streptomyces lutosisoli]|uniref:Aromatic ring-hydroxylating dioxygenase subunit alpha n=1 Tax=Streptomyces lutosisoli TaxID=2665721 RepID=A0ABW2VTJ7_9ACTN
MSDSRLLPARLYHDPDVLAAEQEAVFERTWQVIGHISDLPEPGSFIAEKVGRYEVMVVRDDQGDLAGFRNACRHRGAVLGSGRGAFETKGIRCPYHGWTYRYDGSFLAAPEARTFDCLDRSGLGLPKIRVDTLLGLVFVNLDLDATPLAEHLAGLEELAGRYLEGPLEQFGPGLGVHAWDPKWDQGSNWKVLIDNYLEGYHVPAAHPGLTRLYQYQRYTATPHPGFAFFEAPLRDEPSGNRIERLYQKLVRPMGALSEEDARTWRYALIYPNTMLDLYPDQVNVWRIVPETPDLTHICMSQYRPAGSGLRNRVVQRLNIAINNLVTEEDEAVVVRVQRGSANPGFEFGPVSDREKAVTWFADKIRTSLEGTEVLRHDVQRT